MAGNNIFLKLVSFCFNLKTNNSKKAISSVVATALLLVVTVVAVTGFQGWFSTYLSSDFVKIEQQTSSSGDIRLEKIIDNTLWIINNLASNYTIDKLEIDGNICNNISNLILGLNAINISDCIVNISSNSLNVVMYTDDKITEKYFYMKDAVIGSGGSSSLDCSTLNGGDWIEVPGANFCVMKFEAKCTEQVNGQNCVNGNTLVSQPLSTPWVNINQTDAEIACQSLDVNYHLISDSQWVTIARNAELQNANWNSGTVYSGSMMKGHSDSTPFSALSVSDINNPYDGTGNVLSSIERRTLNLSNGEVIWDIGGNVFEWTSNSFPTVGVLNSSLGLDFGWKEWNLVNTSLYSSLMTLNTSLTSTSGIGQVYVSNIAAFPSGNVHAFLRGGDWSNGADAGAFALLLYYGPSRSDTHLGFRCSFEP